MLKSFGALPSEERAEEMTDRDYLYCAVNMWLDGEEELEALCPSCRARAEEKHCLSCGTRIADTAAERNSSFDLDRFERMMRGGKV